MPSEEQIKAGARVIQAAYEPGYRAALNLARRVLEAVEGKWDSGKFFDGGGPDHDGLAGKPLGDREDRLKGTPFENLSRSKTGSFGVDQLNSLAEKLMIALGDSTTMDTLTGDPGVLVDRIIAERDGLKILNDDLRQERDKALFDKHMATQQFAHEVENHNKALALIQQLQARLPSPPAHEVQILREAVTDSGVKIWTRCSHPECGYEATIEAPAGQLAHQIVDTLADSHQEEMEEDPDGEG